MLCEYPSLYIQILNCHIISLTIPICCSCSFGSGESPSCDLRLAPSDVCECVRIFIDPSDMKLFVFDLSTFLVDRSSFMLPSLEIPPSLPFFNALFVAEPPGFCFCGLGVSEASMFVCIAGNPSAGECAMGVQLEGRVSDGACEEREMKRDG